MLVASWIPPIREQSLGAFPEALDKCEPISQEIDSFTASSLGPDEFLSAASATAIRDCSQVAMSPGWSLGIFGNRRLPRHLQALSIAIWDQPG